MNIFSDVSYLDDLIEKAFSHCGSNGQKFEFIIYLRDRILDRLNHGQSMDCDEYRALRSLGEDA